MICLCLLSNQLEKIVHSRAIRTVITILPKFQTLGIEVYERT